jgi:hypothetical protein
VIFYFRSFGNELNSNLFFRYLRPKRFTLKGYKRNFFVLRELQLSAYRSEEAAADYGQPAREDDEIYDDEIHK